MEPTTRPSLGTSSLTAGAQTAGAGPVSQPGLYPLTVGNRWDYAQEIVVRLIPTFGEELPPERFETTFVRRVEGPVEIGGRTYLEERQIRFGPADEAAGTIFLRQDATGLYEWSPIRSVAANTVRAAFGKVLAARPPAERAAFELAARRLDERIAAVHGAIARSGAPVAELRLPGTASPGELTRLRYPLGPKMRWVVRDDVFHVSSESLGEETLDLPAGALRGHHLRLRTTFQGPSDAVDIWYGPAGFLQLVGHYEFEAVDQGGNLIGHYIYEEREQLTDLTLVGPPAAAHLPTWFSRPGK